MGIQLRLGGRNTGLAGLLLCEVLVDLLGANGATTLHGAGAVGVGCRLGCVGLGLCYRSAGQSYIGLHALSGKAGQDLAALDLVAHIGVQLGHAQAVGFCAQAGFLPSGHAAIGCQLDGQHAVFGLCQVDGQRGFGGGGLASVCGMAASGNEAQRGQGDGACQSEAHGQWLYSQLTGYLGRCCGWCGLKVHGGLASHQ